MAKCEPYQYHNASMGNKQTIGALCGYAKRSGRHPEGSQRSRPNWILGPGSKSGVSRDFGFMWAWKLACKMATVELGNLPTKWPCWLSLWHDINFLAWGQRIISLACFDNNVIHPWPQAKPKFDWEMPPGLTPAICLCPNFVYISTLENWGDKSVGQNSQNIVGHTKFREKLS